MAVVVPPDGAESDDREFPLCIGVFRDVGRRCKGSLRNEKPPAEPELFIHAGLRWRSKVGARGQRRSSPRFGERLLGAVSDEAAVLGMLCNIVFSADNLFSLLYANASGRTALGCAEGADVEIQIPKRSAECVSVHLQRRSGFACVPLEISKDSEDKLSLKFPNSLGIFNAFQIHLLHYFIECCTGRILLFVPHR